MGKLMAFTIVSVDGYFSGPEGEIDWFKGTPDEEGAAFSAEVSGMAGSLLFGRKTYEIMKGFWPTPAGIASDPVTAKVMNERPKFVISGTLGPEKDGPVWKNVTVLSEIRPDGIRRMKGSGDVTILGSGSIVQQLMQLSLIDEYHLMVVPVILGAGRSLFRDAGKLDLVLADTRVFRKSGKVLLTYRPAA